MCHGRTSKSWHLQAPNKEKLCCHLNHFREKGDWLDLKQPMHLPTPLISRACDITVLTVRRPVCFIIIMCQPCPFESYAPFLTSFLIFLLSWLWQTRELCPGQEYKSRGDASYTVWQLTHSPTKSGQLFNLFS